MLILSSSAATSATPASRRISSVGPPGGRSAAVYASHSRNMKFPADGRILSVASSLRSKLLRPIVCVEKVMATGETVEDTGSIALVPVKNFLTPSRDDESTNGAGSEKPESTGHSRTFLEAKTEKELLLGIRKELESGNLSPNVASLMEELYYNYRNAVLQSGIPRAYETILSNMAVQFDRILVDVEEPYAFPPYHMAIREPFDYYTFGQNYIRPLLDFRTSYIGNLSIFADVENKVRQGHNVVLISNHQTEADPAVISILLEMTNPFVSENMTYVAGDRVLTDPLCKPFSMGRNLICVYSRKHMNDIPELVEMKKKANTKSLKEMILLLRSGGQLIWIAPSGGRDRQDSLTGDWYPAPFDPSSVDNIRRLAEYSGVEKQIGERRLIGFHGAGVSLGPEAKLQEVASNYGNPEESKVAFSQALYASVTDQYRVLHSAIHGSKGLDASKPDVLLTQPW